MSCQWYSSTRPSECRFQSWLSTMTLNPQHPPARRGRWAVFDTTVVAMVLLAIAWTMKMPRFEARRVELCWLLGLIDGRWVNDQFSGCFPSIEGSGSNTVEFPGSSFKAVGGFLRQMAQCQCSSGAKTSGILCSDAELSDSNFYISHEFNTQPAVTHLCGRFTGQLKCRSLTVLMPLNFGFVTHRGYRGSFRRGRRIPRPPIVQARRLFPSVMKQQSPMIIRKYFT